MHFKPQKKPVFEAKLCLKMLQSATQQIDELDKMGVMIDQNFKFQSQYERFQKG